MVYRSIYYYVPIVAFLGLACTDIQQESDMPIYEGPVLELTNTTTYYSDSAVVRIKLVAPRQLEFENNDREFTEGIYLEFYEPDGTLSSTLRADYCYHYAKEDRWRALGDVIVRNVANNEQLNTEELFWLPEEEMVYTNKFVRIEAEGLIQMGEGLEAKQDFSWYKIKQSRGTIDLNE